MLFVTSDPLMSSNRHLLKQKSSKLSLEVKQLLREPLDSEEEEATDEEGEEDDDGSGGIRDFAESNVGVPDGGSDNGDADD